VPATLASAATGTPIRTWSGHISSSERRHLAQTSARFGISANYYRRQFNDITFTTDLAKPFSVYTPYQVRDPRGNGQMMTVYNINPAALRSLTELDTTSSNNTSAFNSVDVGVNLRFGNGVMLNGGTATGRSQTTTCDVTDPNSTWYCDDAQFDVPWRTTFKMSGLYPLPWGIRLSGVFQSTAGSHQPDLLVTAGTNQTGVAMGQSSATLGSASRQRHRDRVKQLDFTLAKTFMNRIRLTPR
jgi:hypothetical protein